LLRIYGSYCKSVTKIGVERLNYSAGKLAILAVLIALCMGTAFAAEDANNTKSKIVITNTSLKATSPEKQNLNGEWVEIANQGSLPQNLAGWTLSDQDNHTYTFKDFTLAAEALVKVHTGIGEDTAEDLYWNMKIPVWNNDGDQATLKDASGNAVARYPEEVAKR
jgi:hypothetical protein